MDRDELAFAGAARQAELVRSGEVSPRELVDLYLERIERIDPKLNAFRIVLAERARAEAEEAERRRSSGDAGPLNGVPIAIKDTQDLEGEVTMHGTSCFDRPAAADTEMVRRLRAAGAIVLGKTNLPELAILPFTESKTFGITRNPWNTERSTGGSSGGSAAAVAAGLAPIGSASDGGGSIRIPAAHCGLFGLKPQRGRISMAPDPEHWRGLSVTGCVSRTVLDTALYLDITAGALPSDVDRAPDPDRPFVEAASSPPGKLRVATWVKPVQGFAPPITTDEVRGAVEDTGELLRSLGHSVERKDPGYRFVGNQFVPLYVGGISDDFHRLPHPERAEDRTKGFAKLGDRYPGFVKRRAKEARDKQAAKVNRIFEDHDVLITPTVGAAGVEVRRWEGKGALRTVPGISRIYSFTGVWNYLGNPAAAVPVGFTDDGLPLSVQIIGRPNDEATLLSLAAQIEAERPWADRRPPVS
jgi:amidase